MNRKCTVQFDKEFGKGLCGVDEESVLNLENTRKLMKIIIIIYRN